MGLDRSINLDTKTMKEKNKNGSNFVREICVAGPCIDVAIKYSSNRQGQRAPKTNPTREAVLKNNDRIAVKKLTRLLNANFFPGDWHITLTYDGEIPAEKEAKKELKNFLRRIEREYKKAGKVFKYIAVTEYKNHRIHHHVVVSHIDSDIIIKQWKRGHVNFSPLNNTRNYRKLAEYLIKETSKTLREPGNEVKQRWSASRNLIRPVVMRQSVQPKALYEEPKAFKGYQIDPDTVCRFENPYTGIEHLEYMMVSMDPVPRIKSWRSGIAVDKQETMHRATQVQMRIDSLDEWYFA